MQREEIFEAWVPPAGAWSLWARPVLFAQMSEQAEEPAQAPAARADTPWLGSDPSWVPQVGEHVAIVIDLDGEQSVHMGVALAGCGYRPVPLYNGCTGPAEVIDQGPILQALRREAAYLRSLALPEDAPPAFLLDARRMDPRIQVPPGAFDNRWQAFPQDFPSAALLRTRGIKRVILLQEWHRQPQEDLAHVLRRWQDAGITIEVKYLRDPGPATRIVVDRPLLYRKPWYRVLSILGLRPSAKGGFGGIVPEPRHG